MKNIVILGAGTAGTLVSNMLSRRLSLKDWKITVIDKAEQHLYQPGLLFVPFRLYDYEGPDDIVRPITSPISKNVDLVKAEIKLIDHANKKVETDAGTFHYDWLVSSLGCRMAPEEVDGMAESYDGSANTFYTLPGAMALQRALDGMNEGKLVVHISEMPIKCPVAPIEFAFLADYYFHKRGIRDRVEIELVTPLDGAFTKPVASKVLGDIAARKNIRITPNFSIESVDGDAKTISSFEGETVNYDVLASIPPNMGPEVLEESGLGDGTGFALTHPRTLQARKAENVYMIGDNTNVSASKAGSVAHFEAETVVENLLREIEGKPPLPSFDGHANCYIESGFDKALLIDFNYDMEPLPGEFPMPGMGPFSLLEESYINHMGKLAFKWIYWHMLLPGHMGHVPLLPSHMSFIGKELESAPQVRRSQKLKIEDVMTREIATVPVGTPVAQAAQILTDKGVSGLPVVDVEGKLAGVLTEADFLSAMDVQGDSTVQQLFDLVIRRKRGKKRMGTIVEDLMTPDPVTANLDDTLQSAITVMDRNKIKRLIVIDEERKPIGVVSRADVVKVFLGK